MALGSGSQQQSASPAQLLRRVPLFQNCSADELDDLSAACESRQFSNGVTLLAPGQPADFLTLIETGGLRIRNTTGRPVGEVGAGHFIGDGSLLQPHLSEVTLETTAPSRVHVLHRDDLARLVADHPSLGASTGLDRVLADGPDSEHTPLMSGGVPWRLLAPLAVFLLGVILWFVLTPYILPHVDYLRGNLAQQRGDMAAAREHWAAAASGGLAEAYNNLGVLHMQEGDLDSAAAALHIATDLDPTLSSAWTNLAQVYRVRGQSAEAEEALERAAGHATAAQDAVALVELGRLREARGDYPGAVEAYRAAVRLAPDSFAAQEGLGVVLYAQGALPEATTAFQAAATLHPDSATAQLGLGLAQLALGNPEAALRPLQQTVRLQPEEPVAYYALGVTLQRLGDAETAAEHFHTALELQPGDHLAADIRSHLEEVSEP